MANAKITNPILISILDKLPVTQRFSDWNITTPVVTYKNFIFNKQGNGIYYDLTPNTTPVERTESEILFALGIPLQLNNTPINDWNYKEKQQIVTGIDNKYLFIGGVIALFLILKK